MKFRDDAISIFRSDNITAVCPEIMEAVQAANLGDSTPYGGDALTKGLNESFSGLFETSVEVLPVATGIAANALSIAAITPSFGAVYCHERAHIHTTECGAPEFWTGGAKLVPFPGAHNRLRADDIAHALGQWNPKRTFDVRPAAVSLTQGTEAGTVYAVADIARIAAIAHEHGLHVHMDGARLANALASLGCSLAEVTWKSGVDILSFGATKNGGMCADAVVVFKPELMETARYTRLRAGHEFSKMRFLSAQLEAMVADGLYLRNAAHANAMARRLGDGLVERAGGEIVHPTEINELFIRLPTPVTDGLVAGGIPIRPLAKDDPRPFFRFVTAWNTSPADVDGLVACAADLAT